MSRGFQGAVLKAMGAPEFRLQVVSTALECGGLMKRVSFISPDALPESLFEPAAWVRLWFPAGAGREVQRRYTIAGYAQDRSRVDVSFYLHQTSGPAASWALHVRAGSELIANVADHSHSPSTSAARVWFCLATRRPSRLSGRLWTRCRNACMPT